MNVKLIALAALAMATAEATASAQDTASRSGPLAASDARAVEKPLASAVEVQGPEYTPMTRSERLRWYLKGTFGVGSVARAGMLAEIGQARNSPSEWGDGAEGYGKRFASAYGQH